MVKKLAESTSSNGKNNISFLSYLLLGDLDKCLQLLIDTDRLPEAAFFARSYLPSKMSYVVGLWKESLSKTNVKASESLANPDEYENLFPHYQESLKTELYLRPERQKQLPASAYARLPVSYYNIIESTEIQIFNPFGVHVCKITYMFSYGMLPIIKKCKFYDRHISPFKNQI